MSPETEARNTPVDLEYFVICGLGSLGQHCVTALTEFGVKIVAIEQQLPASWEIESLRDLLDNLIIGDCRHNDILNQAKIKRCRAALIVTTDDRVNVETAIAIRQLNPRTRLVVRSGKENLNQLLSQRLGHFIAFDPTELSTAAFTLAALGTEILGFFDLDGHIWQIYRRFILADDSWCESSIFNLETNYRKILAHTHQTTNSNLILGDWNARDVVWAGDTVVYLNVEAKQWQIRIETALTTDAIFEGANAIARVTGCSLILARETMNNLPQTLPILLYQHQAQRLVRELKKTLVISRLLPPR